MQTCKSKPLLSPLMEEDRKRTDWKGREEEGEGCCQASIECTHFPKSLLLAGLGTAFGARFASLLKSNQLNLAGGVHHPADVSSSRAAARLLHVGESV